MSMAEYIAQLYDPTEIDSLDKMLSPHWLRFDANNLGHMIVVEAQPGNGTRYSFVLVKVNNVMAKQMSLPEGGYLLAMEPGFHWRGTMSVRGLGESHPSYIIEKLGMNASDAVAMALILDRVKTVVP